ncbi:hypothetical protein GE061_002769 [Apolygus lucorum]|uniref:Uncharacterized protein n=1 Tax=Apolygus lucorum TaxID=248454 RepID=A0A8S9X7V1_APOLU|nr:hypothetical protein GE061_002769 [Apolygus lucorum]
MNEDHLTVQSALEFITPEHPLAQEHYNDKRRAFSDDKTIVRGTNSNSTVQRGGDLHIKNISKPTGFSSLTGQTVFWSI